MKTTKYLTIDNDGRNPKITSKPTGCEPWQAQIRLSIEIPDAYFTRPALSAEITLPARDVTTVSAEVQNLIKDAVEKTTGHRLILTVLGPDITPAKDPS